MNLRNGTDWASHHRHHHRREASWWLLPTQRESYKVVVYLLTLTLEMAQSYTVHDSEQEQQAVICLLFCPFTLRLHTWNAADLISSTSYKTCSEMFFESLPPPPFLWPVLCKTQRGLIGFLSLRSVDVRLSHSQWPRLWRGQVALSQHSSVQVTYSVHVVPPGNFS